MMMPTMSDMTWTVRVHRWTWKYKFTRSGAVSWRDPFNGMGGSGTWKIQGQKLITRWNNSQTWEEWDLPINTQGATGKAHMKDGTYDINAVADAVEVSVEVFTRSAASKTKFLESCSIATGRIQLASLNFSRWLSSITIAYGEGFESHNRVIDDIKADVKLKTDMILGFALAFLGGGAGGYVGGVMKSMAYSDFLIDGIKDLAKFGVRANSAFVPPPGIKKFPSDSPTVWSSRVNERVSGEMAEAARQLDRWRTAVSNDDDSFNANFDPATEIDKALRVNLASGPPLRLSDLPAVDKDDLQKTFEFGWLAGWIESIPKESFLIPPYSANETRSKLTKYAQKLGKGDIQKLLDDHIPPYSMAPSLGFGTGL